MSKENLDLVVTIMAGGVGTRFWPLSTATHPKQFLNLFGDRTLLQMSYDRVAPFVQPDRVLVLTNKAFVSTVQEQLPDLPAKNIISEPMRRDTGAAVALAAALCQHRFDNPAILTITSDHLINPQELFQQTVLSAAKAAVRTGALYTFGIPPTYPATGYGYLEQGQLIERDKGIDHFRLARFKEKPDRKTAHEYMESGRYYWNSGMFVWTANSIIREIKIHLPEHAKIFSDVIVHDGTPEWDDQLRDAFKSLPKISIDFGVMEKAANVCCVASKFSWDDVGGWRSLLKYLPKDNAGNSYRGDLHTLDARNNLVFSKNREETIMLVGVENLVIVRSGKKTLVTHKDKTEEIKKLVKKLNDQSK